MINNRIKIQVLQDYDDFLAKKKELEIKMKMSRLTIIDHVSKRVDEQYNFLKQQNHHIENMYSDYNDLIEYKKVIEVSKTMLDDNEMRNISDRLDSLYNSDRNSKSVNDQEDMRMLMNDSFMSETSSEVFSGSGVKVGRIVGT